MFSKSLIRLSNHYNHWNLQGLRIFHSLKPNRFVKNSVHIYLVCVFSAMGRNGICSTCVLCFIWPQPLISEYWKTVVGFCSFWNMLDSKRSLVFGNEINMIYSVFSAEMLENANCWSLCRFGLMPFKYALRKWRYYCYCYYYYNYYYFVSRFLDANISCVRNSWTCSLPSRSYLSGYGLYFLQ